MVGNTCFKLKRHEKIVANTPDFILDLTPTDTANYAEEDIVLMVKETVKNLYLPPMAKIKGNPNIYLYVDTSQPVSFNLYLTGGDFFTSDAYTNPPEGRISAIPNITFNTPPDGGGERILMTKPIIDGAWFFFALFNGK